MEYGRSQLEQVLSGGLPGFKAHQLMIPPGRPYVDYLSIPAETRESGVLVLLFPKGEIIHTCLIKRAGHMKIHASQIGFPGGSREPNDKGTRETALREAWEEIGTVPEEIVTLGPLTPLYIPVSGFMIHPWLAWSDTLPHFNLNREEVEKILLFPLPSGRKHLPVVTSRALGAAGEWLNVPSVQYDGEIIWGATAMILSELAAVIARINPKLPSG